MFSLKKYRRPDAIHTPSYFWFLNAKLEDEELREQIRDMARKGVRIICPHPFPREFRKFFMSSLDGYLSEEYFAKYRVIAEECARLHLDCYLYDEGGWPSGGACGQVYASNPKKFERHGIVADGAGKVKITTEAVDPASASPIPDVLVKGATEKFLELTHEQYYRHLKKDGTWKRFRFAFTDEPQMPRCNLFQLGWTKDLESEFRKRKGYDVAPHYADMLSFRPIESEMKARVDYYDVMSQLFVERYLIPIRDWCRAHGILSGGHFGGEDEIGNLPYTGYGHILRALRALDFPGVDLIWRQLWPGWRMHYFPKFASSVANQGGHRFVSGEVFGVYGNGLTFGQMRSLIDYMVVCGVNTFVACSKPYSTKGGLIEGERPHWGPKNPMWRHIRGYHEYVSRVSMLGATGRPVVGTGVFLDVRSIWALPRYAEYVQEMLTQITEYLFQHQIDFDFIDDDALAAARVEHGKIRIGRALYDQIVIPKFANLAPEAEARRKRLVAAGCTVLTQEELGYIQPTLAVTVLGPNESAIRVRKHSLGQGEALYFVYNNSAETSIFTLSPKERFPVARCDSETGRLEAIRGTHGVWGYDIPPYRMEVFLVGKAAANAEKPQLVPETVKLTLTDGWKMRPVRRISVGKDDFVEETLRGGAKRGKLGDWAALVGSEYSGDIVYTIDFQAPRGARYLDLGKVGYCAEVKLNGKALGTRLFEPYWFALGEALQKGTNHLEVRVTNTLANAILAKGVWERWKKELPYEWPYEVMERDYEKESIPSGLFGPVTIR